MASALHPPRMPAVVAPSPRLRQAAVVSVQTGPPQTLTIHLAGDTSTDITGVRHLDSYVPVAADTVWVLQNDSDFLVIGRLAVSAAVGGGLFARKTATESVTSSAVMQDDDHLFLTVEANAVYQLEMVVRYDGAAGTSVGELKMQFVMPAGAGFTGLMHGFQFAATDNTGDLMQAVLDGAVMQTGTRGASTFLTAHVVGSLVVAGTAGTLQLQWAQDSSNATPTRVIVGSYLSLRRVA